jgi:hypothetical protein
MITFPSWRTPQFEMKLRTFGFPSRQATAAGGHCTFCGLNGSSMQFRSKSADRAIAEIHHLLTTYGNRPLAAVDNIIDHSYLNTVVPRLKERIRSLPRKPRAGMGTQ